MAQEIEINIKEQPAFPTQELSHWEADPVTYAPVGIYRTIPGMTLRQYAAIKIMAGALSNPGLSFGGDVHAELSVKAADALLAELAK